MDAKQKRTNRSLPRDIIAPQHEAIKTCRKCGILFSERHCKACAKVSQAAYRATHPVNAEKERAYRAKYRAEHPEKMKAKRKKYSALQLAARRVFQAKYRAENPGIVKARREKWAANNVEKVRAHRAKYYAANSNKLREKNKKYRASHHAEKMAYNKKWRAANPEKGRAYKAKYRATYPEKVLADKIKWRAETVDARRAYNAKWRSEHPEARRIFAQNRRAKERAGGGVLSKGLAEKLFGLQKGKCPCCGNPLGDDYHLDHTVPVSLGGANEDWNIQLLAKGCNLSKQAKHPIDFMQSRGFLL